MKTASATELKRKTAEILNYVIYTRKSVYSKRAKTPHRCTPGEEALKIM